MLYIYAKNNLVVLNIYIKVKVVTRKLNENIPTAQSPVVTRIWRDEKMPIISFVAHAGGLLGLCMGFSLVSLFEIAYYTLSSLPWRNKKNKEKKEQQLYTR